MEYHSRMKRAFTIVEMLVVITIIVLLAGLVLPVLVKSHKAANRTRDQADMQAIATAINAYHQEFGDYPRPTDVNPYRGAVILCRAILGPSPESSDGADGFGFRVRNDAVNQIKSKVSGPYLQPDKWKIGFLTGTDWNQVVMLDRYKSPILYYVAAAGSRNLVLPNAYAATATPPAQSPGITTFNFYDNSTLMTDLNRFRQMLGDVDLDGALRAGEKGISAPFVLWSAGPNETFGPAIDPLTQSVPDRQTSAEECDDVLYRG